MERKAKAITTQLKVRLHPAGDRCLIVEFGQKIAPDINRAVRSLAAYLLQHPLAGVTDVVPAFATVAIHYRPEAIEGLRAGASPHNLLCEQVQAILLQGLAPQQGDARWVEIPVCYEGEFAHDKFRFGVLRPDPGHDFGSELRRDRIQGALDITP